MIIKKTSFNANVPEFVSINCKRLLKFPCFAEIKYDGEYNMYTGGALYNKYGTMRTHCPITEYLETLKPTPIIGELTWKHGKAAGIYDLISNKRSHELIFRPFDIVVENLTYEDRRDILIDLVGWSSSYVIPAVCHYIESKEELIELFNETVADGYEGLVIKNCGSRSLYWIKIKAKWTADLMVSYVEPIKERIEVNVPYKTGNGDAFVTCGVKVPMRQGISDKLKIGDVVEIQHYGVLSGGRLRHPVYKRKREDGKRVNIDEAWSLGGDFGGGNMVEFGDL